MNRERILSVVAAFVEEESLGEIGPGFQDVKVTDYLQESLEAVELMMILEEELGLDDLEVDLDAIAPKLIQATFGELADELLAFLRSSGVDIE